jgi:hypothetical protein
MKMMENFRHAGSAGHRSVENAANYLIRFGEEAAPIDAGCSGAHGSLTANISEVAPPDVEIEYLFLRIQPVAVRFGLKIPQSPD